MIDSAGELALWAKVAAIGQVASALATTAAVIVSLWIALSERRANVKVTAGLRMNIPGDGTPATDVIAIIVVNQGTRIVRVVNLGWRSGWLRRRGPSFLRQQYALQNASVAPGSVSPPFDLEPFQEKTIQVRVAEFNAPAEHRESFFTRQLPFSRVRRPANVCVVVFVVAAKNVIARVEEPLAHFLATGEVKKGAAWFNANSKGALKVDDGATASSAAALTLDF